MVIAMDVDGVLRDFIAGVDAAFLAEHREYTYRDLVDSESYDLALRYPIGKAIYHFIFQDHVSDIFSQSPVIDGAVEFMRMARKRWRVGVITSQNEKSWNATLVWLGINGLAPDFVCVARFDRKPKVSKATFPADVLVDDCVDNLLEWEAAGRTAVCFRQRWNRQYQGKTVSNFEELFEHLLYIDK